SACRVSPMLVPAQPTRWEARASPSPIEEALHRPRHLLHVVLHLLDQEALDEAAGGAGEQARNRGDLGGVHADVALDADAGAAGADLLEVVHAARVDRLAEGVGVAAPRAGEARRIPNRVVGPRKHRLGEEGPHRGGDVGATVPDADDLELSALLLPALHLD